MSFPDFNDTDIIRKRIIFKGRVQRVGFRYEARLIAQKLSLTGTACNMKDGSVLVELQGSAEKIDCFIYSMQNISRIIITDYHAQSMPLADEEKSFMIVD